MRAAGKLALAGVLVAMGVTAAAQAQDWAALGKSWWAHVQYLASDELEGRGTGTPGFEKAAAYVEKEFREAGLQPAGVNGYAQPVEFNVVQLDEPKSSLEFVRGGKAEKVKFGDEAYLAASSSTFGTVRAQAVFVGYGLSIPEAHYDDLAGQDLKGKIAVYVTGGPASLPTELKAHYQSNEERAKAFLKAGAVGVAVIQNPRAAEVPWSRMAGSRFSQKMELKDGAKAGTGWPKAKIIVNPEYAEKLFAGSGHTLQEILDAIKDEKPLPHFPLAVIIRARTAIKRSSAKSENIAGVLPGSDAKLKNEYVVVSAHLDHLGIGTPLNGDAIYNGAMDDASGVASVIEIAKAMQKSAVKPKRSILFLAVTAEEKGELGSQYFAAHPTVKGPIVADINMDMYLPLFPLKYLEVQGLNESTLGDDIRVACKEAGVEAQADKEPEHVRFIRSDQYSFIKRGVPALAFKFGWLPNTPEQKTFQDWYKERYHGPADDVSQPVDREAAAQFDAILEKLALRVANAGSRPEWKKESFFRRFAKD
jgi:Zn-dependent M28 family amino/carboxypeptidase